MLTFFNKKTINSSHVKHVSLYISEQEEKIIIAPLYKNNAGIYYEQEKCSVLKFPAEATILGDEVIKSFHLFKLQDKNLRDQKLKDWPAFIHSKLKTVKAFESLYFKIRIDGVNAGNIFINIEGNTTTDNDMIIKSSLPATTDTKAIGERIMKVYKACITGII
ncbi:hypothetical protein [Mucilaginibacter ginsenosidivorax]|uniref:Uncharacterized protein n=1 Tax=Mucilaginibacter ginsenosidivorax TaxID=862126 RepID=A0A5B8VWJ1_9SPHI|nr:hypothetical protein [Mucilaginibacter ginsenosidivorax]QEC74985.1 hypothetical protein FSB76_03110 [Mucilaginibacter ginsenosidivorax]